MSKCMVSLKETKDQKTEKPEANIIENGRCVICGKPLEENRLFVCEDCSKKMGTEK